MDPLMAIAIYLASLQQVSLNPNNVNNVNIGFVIARPPIEPSVEIFSNDDEGRMLVVIDSHGDTILTVYRDGHVIAKNQSKIDESAKEFWMLMAKYEGEFCKEPTHAK